MKKLVLVALVILSGVALADPPPAADPAPGAPAAAAPSPLEQQCRELLNGDPAFKTSVANKLGIQLDAETVKVHQDADARVKLDERHVIYAYAAMWVIAALFVLFLFRRQQLLKSEIAALRRDLDAAEKK